MKIFGVNPIIVDRKSIKSIAGILSLSFKMARQGYQYVIDLHIVSRTIPITIACFFYGSKIAFVRKYAIRRRLSAFFHKLILPPKKSVIIENITAVRRALPQDYKTNVNSIPRLKISNSRLCEIENMIGIEDLQKSIVISPFSSRKTKDLTSQQIYSIIKALNSIDIKPILLGSKEDLMIFSDFNDDKITYYNLIGKTDIETFVYILYNTRATISVDSSALYLASIIGKPTVGIYGPTDPRTGFTPLPPTKSVFIELACRPCSIHGSDNCKLRNRICIEEIKTKRVISALKELIDI